jgi:hypothetical protein
VKCVLGDVASPRRCGSSCRHSNRNGGIPCLTHVLPSSP